MAIPSVFIFSWNTQSHPMDVNTPFALPPQISDNKPDIVVFGTQEDRKPGSYLQSDVFPSLLSPLGYTLVTKTRMMGLGKTCYKGVFSMDLFTRGCRVSCYVRNELVPLTIATTTTYTCCFYTRNKGAAVVYCTIQGYQPCVFICCHMPFDSQSLDPSSPWTRSASRICLSNYYLNQIIEQIVITPDYLTYIFGDLNYRMTADLGDITYTNLTNSNSSFGICGLSTPKYEFADVLNYIEQFDEFRQQVSKANIPYLEEGPLLFAPTNKLQVNRLPGELSWRRGKRNQRNPSWTDRICGMFNGDDRPRCIYYNRYENETTIHSDHCAVIALWV